MDIKKIKKLIELLEQSGISEMEIKEGKESIKLCKHLPVMPQHLQQIPQMIVSSPPFNSNTHANFNSNFINHSHKHHETSTLETSHIHPVVHHNTERPSLKSPMVGTFYKSSSPDAKPFVAVGDHVNIGDVLCIIEAMKMFNQIEAEYAGTIEAVLVESGQPVEFGQALFVIKPD